MSGHRVDLDRLGDVVGQMARVEAELRTAIDDAEVQANRVRASWGGTAADEYAATQRRWRHDADEMHEALGAMRRIGCTAHENYRAATGTNSVMWSQCR